jgi:hypothetical protein
MLCISTFRRLINSTSHDGSFPFVFVQRLPALEVRSGRSSLISSTFIAQVARQYGRGVHPLRPGQPWIVRFDGEQGIDAGGLARDLASEVALDICTPNCGVCIETPNARAGVGKFRDCVIPFARPGADRDLLRFVGMFIGICIRAGLPHDFRFPPVVWDYLAHGVLLPELVLEIDDGFAALLEHGQSFVTTTLTGSSIPLTAGGRTEAVTAANRQMFIALAKAQRFAEMQESLALVHEGLWQVFGFGPIATLSGDVIEIFACGQGEITVNALRETTFLFLPNESARMFWNVVEQLTSEERSALLKFATGSPRIPIGSTHRLRVTSSGPPDQCPTAATCSCELHWPEYSSLDIALRRVRAAINFGGGFAFV